MRGRDNCCEATVDFTARFRGEVGVKVGMVGRGNLRGRRGERLISGGKMCVCLCDEMGDEQSQVERKTEINRQTVVFFFFSTFSVCVFISLLVSLSICASSCIILCPFASLSLGYSIYHCFFIFICLFSNVSVSLTIFLLRLFLSVSLSLCLFFILNIPLFPSPLPFGKEVTEGIMNK